MSIQLRQLMTIEILLGPPVDLGDGRRYLAFDGGSFESRGGTSGTVLAGGADWQVIRPDGVIEIDAHYALLTEEAEAIEVQSKGLRKMSGAQAAQIARGDAVAGPYYFRTHVRLSTSAPRLAWLNDLIAVSTGQREQHVVRLDVHEVL
ncbi:MAG: DUF3237 domain-containing protein [Acidimicrobiales bacterium]